MKVIKLKGKTQEHEIELYETIEQLSGKRYNVYNKWSLMSAGIGSTMDDINRHHTRLDMFLNGDKINEAKQERMQLQNCMFLALNEINPRHLTFAALVSKIDGQPQDDLSQEGLQRICDRLSEMDLSHGVIVATLEEVKKNLIPS